MDLATIFTIGVQFLAIAVLIAMLAILIKSLEVEPFFRGRPGGKLMKIIIGVVFGFTLAQAVAVLNVFGILVLDTEAINGLHNGFRLLQQIIVIITCIWGWRKLKAIV